MSLREALAATALTAGVWAAAASPAEAVTATRSVPFQRGVTVGEWGRYAYPSAPTRRTLRRLRDRRHVRWVTLFAVWMQRNERSSNIAPGRETVLDSSLRRAMRQARALGLRIVLRPYLDLANRGWRGNVRPASRERWWRDYRRFILHYATIARQERASMFVVGSEMGSRQGDAPEWRSLIRATRSRFHRLVAYEANFDALGTVAWWDAVDVIDISAYFPVASTASPTVDQLVAGWQAPFAQLQALHDQTGKPVMFGEIGYTSSTLTATLPYQVDMPAPYSPRAQADAYRAALQVWWDVPWFCGFAWWFVPTHRSAVGQRPGHEHIPTASALSVLGDFYRQPR